MCWDKRKVCFLPLRLSAPLSPSGYIYLSNQLHTTRLIEKYRKNNKRVRHIKDIQDLLSECGASLSPFPNDGCVCHWMCVCLHRLCLCLSIYYFWKHTGLYQIMRRFWIFLGSWQNTRQQDTSLHTADIKVLLFMIRPGKETAGQQMLEKIWGCYWVVWKWTDPVGIFLCDKE